MGEQQQNLEVKSPLPKKSDHNWSFFFLRLVFFLAIVLDQLIKHFAGRDFLNYNFAFSLPVPIMVMYLIYALVILGMVYYVGKNYQRLTFFARLAWALIFAGALSNIIERIILGYVRDFIYISLFHWTGIYNLADFYIILGIVILLLPKKELRSKN